MIIGEPETTGQYVMQAFIRSTHQRLRLLTIYSDIDFTVSHALYYYIRMFIHILSKLTSDKCNYHIELGCTQNIFGYITKYHVYIDDFENISEIIEKCDLSVLDITNGYNLTFINDQSSKQTTIDSDLDFKNIYLIVTKPIPKERLQQLINLTTKYGVEINYEDIQSTSTLPTPTLLTIKIDNIERRDELCKNIINLLGDYIDTNRLLTQWPYSIHPIFIDNSDYKFVSPMVQTTEFKLHNTNAYQVNLSATKFEDIIQLLNANNYKFLTKDIISYPLIDLFTLFYFYNLETKDFALIVIYTDEQMELYLSDKNLYNLIIINY